MKADVKEIKANIERLGLVFVFCSAVDISVARSEFACYKARNQHVFIYLAESFIRRIEKG